MKPFTIRKATNPGKPVADASHDASQKYNASAPAGMRGDEEFGSGAEDEHL